MKTWQLSGLARMLTRPRAGASTDAAPPGATFTTTSARRKCAGGGHAQHLAAPRHLHARRDLPLGQAAAAPRDVDRVGRGHGDGGQGTRGFQSQADLALRLPRLQLDLLGGVRLEADGHHVRLVRVEGEVERRRARHPLAVEAHGGARRIGDHGRSPEGRTDPRSARAPRDLSRPAARVPVAPVVPVALWPAVRDARPVPDPPVAGCRPGRSAPERPTPGDAPGAGPRPATPKQPHPDAEAEQGKHTHHPEQGTQRVTGPRLRSGRSRVLGDSTETVGSRRAGSLGWRGRRPIGGLELRERIGRLRGGVLAAAAPGGWPRAGRGAPRSRSGWTRPGCAAGSAPPRPAPP